VDFLLIYHIKKSTVSDFPDFAMLFSPSPAARERSRSLFREVKNADGPEREQ
jgi:hypothetical protein